LQAIDRALVVRAEERTQSIAQLRADMGLEPSLPMSTPTPGARAPKPGPEIGKSRQTAASLGRPLWWAAGAGVLLLGASVVAWLALLPTPQPTAPASPSQTVPNPVAVASAIAPPPPPPQAVGLDASREFSELVLRQAPEFALKAAPAREQVRIGRDDLGFSLTTGRPGWLYVFALASDGTLAQVLPNTVSGSVRLKSGQSYRFPSGNGVILEAAEPAGMVQLLLMVSASERDFSALEPEKAGPMRLFKTGSAAASIVALHTGSGPLLAGRVLCPPGSSCDESYGATLLKVQVLE